MTFSDFTDADLNRLFGIQANSARLFDDVAALEPKAWLKETLERGKIASV